MLPVGTREAVTDALTEQGTDFAFAGETSGREYTDVLFVPAETDDVETIIDTLRDAGVEREGYVVVSEATAVVSEDPVDIPNERSGTGHRVSREELHATMTEELRNPTEYLLFTVLSAVLATAGLLLDSPTVVTGSMVVAPVLGPAVASSIGNVIGNDDLVRTGIVRQLAGLAVAITSATGFAFLSRVLFAPNPDLLALGQVGEFSSPTALALAIALIAGIAGALSLTTGTSTSLIGVAVAAALVPPASVVGLGVAYGERGLAVGAGVLALVNLLAINLTSLVTLRVAGYRPEGWFERQRVRRLFTRQALALVLGVLVVSSVVGAATLNQRENAAFERDVTRITDRIDGRALSVDVRYETTVLFREPRAVVVRAGMAPPEFATRLRERIRRHTGESVAVVVYEASSVAGSDVPAAANGDGPARMMGQYHIEWTGHTGRDVPERASRGDGSGHAPRSRAKG